MNDEIEFYHTTEMVVPVDHKTIKENEIPKRILTPVDFSFRATIIDIAVSMG